MYAARAYGLALRVQAKDDLHDLAPVRSFLGGVQEPQIGLEVAPVIRRDVRLVGRVVVERRNGHARTPEFVYTLDVRLEITTWFGLITAKAHLCTISPSLGFECRWLPRLDRSDSIGIRGRSQPLFLSSMNNREVFARNPRRIVMPGPVAGGDWRTRPTWTGLISARPDAECTTRIEMVARLEDAPGIEPEELLRRPSKSSRSTFASTAPVR